MIRLQKPGRFGRVGQFFGFLLSWWFLNFVIARILLIWLLGVHGTLVAVAVTLNFFLALFIDVLEYRTPAERPHADLAHGSTTGSADAPVSFVDGSAE